MHVISYKPFSMYQRFFQTPCFLRSGCQNLRSYGFRFGFRELLHPRTHITFCSSIEPVKEIRSTKPILKDSKLSDRPIEIVGQVCC